MNNGSVYAIIGPTASGKSSSVENFVINGEFSCVNFDSCQIFKELPVLKAMPEIEYEHYLYGIYDQSVKFSCYDWCLLAKKTIFDIEEKKRVPILIGGTGFYLKSFIDGVVELPEISQEVLADIELFSAEKIIDKLKENDFESYKKYKDLRRIKKALGVYLTNNKTLDYYYCQEKNKINNKKIITLAIIPNREDIKLKIESRLYEKFDFMVNEVSEIGDGFEKIIGVTEIKKMLDGNITKKKCLDLMFYRTCQYAKRQVTYIRNCLKVDKIFENNDTLKSFILMNAS